MLSEMTLPNLVALKHFFSASAQVLKVRRRRLSDKTMHKVVFLSSAQK